MMGKRSDRGHWAAPAAILLAGAALRFYGIWGKALWVDEGYTAALTYLPYGELIRGVFMVENHPPLYFALMRLWTLFGLLSGSDWFLRAFSALVSLGMVAGVYAVGKEGFGKKEGLAAAGLAAVSAYQIYFAQEARHYALVGALGIWGTYFLLRGLSGKGRVRDWVWYAALSAAALWTFYYSVFLVVAQAVVGLAWIGARRGGERQGEIARSWVASEMVIALSFIPLAFAALTRVEGKGTAEVGLGVESLKEALVQYGAWIGTRPPEAIMGLAGVLLLLFPLWCAVMRMRGKGLEVLTMAILFGLPFGLVAVFPYKPFGFEGKHLFFVTGFYWVLAAVGLVRVRAAGVIAVAAIVALNAAALAFYYPDSFQKEDWRWVVSVVGEKFEEGDGIYLNPLWGIYSFERYWTKEYLGDELRRKAPAVARDGEVNEDWLVSVLSSYKRVWLVEVKNKALGPDPKVEAWLRGEMHVKMQVRRLSGVGEIRLLLFERGEGR